MLTFLTSVDGTDHRAWGAMIDEPAGEVGAGVVRWVRTQGDPAVADLAVTVIDDYQGRGLGGLLLDVAVLDAFACGVERFEGVVLGENVSSRRMLARGGALLRPDGGGVLAFTLALRPRVDALRRSPPRSRRHPHRRAKLTTSLPRHDRRPDAGAGGPIALVGSGEFLPAMEAVDAALLAGRPARAVFLPTAAAPEGPERVAYWLRLGTEHYRRLGVEPVPLRVLDRRDADDPALAPQVAGAGLVYLSGGNPGYLADTLRGTAVLEAILAAWQAGAALAGCSAGACALTAAGRRHPDGHHPARAGPGARLVVLPHFDRIERWSPGIVARRPATWPRARPWSGSTRRRRWSAATAAGGSRAADVWIVDPDGRRSPHPAGAVLDCRRRARGQVGHAQEIVTGCSSSTGRFGPITLIEAIHTSGRTLQWPTTSSSRLARLP